MTVMLYQGDCLEVMATLPADSVDSIITDPPYGLSFMGKDWDHGVPGAAFWREALRVAKPGAMLLAFGGTRTWHRLAVAIEDAGWEIRDTMMWLYGQGFPKSHDISKAIDKRGGANIAWFGPWLREERKRRGISSNQLAQHFPSKTGGETGCVRNWELSLNLPTPEQFNKLCEVLDLPFDSIHEAEREVIGKADWSNSANHFEPGKDHTQRVRLDITAPATPEAEQWQGWGTSLKPAFEPVLVAQKPLSAEQEQAIIVGNLLQLEAQLWLLLHASTVENDSRLSPAELDAALSIAQWTVAESISIRDALRGQMDMSPFASAITTTLSTVSLWRGILEEALSRGSTSTTETESKTTIDWKTLSFLLSEITLENIIRAEIEAPGSRLSALPAGAYLNAVAMRQSATRTLSALESATSEARILRQGVAGKELAPNWEPIILAQKPIESTYAANALKYGVAGLWIDGARIEAGNGDYNHPGGRPGGVEPGKNGTMGKGRHNRVTQQPPNAQGRWPANVILDDEAARALDEQSGERVSGGKRGGATYESNYSSATSGQAAFGKYDDAPHYCYGDTGGASRFFYCAKSSRRERNIGLPEGMTNGHPTVKPLSLMQYLCRLTKTPTGGVVLDPFMGSGTTGMAAVMEGRDFIGIELDGDYLEIARRRITAAAEQARQLALTLE